MAMGNLTVAIGPKANDRVRCCVPFCQRTRARASPSGQSVDEFICATHWRAANAELRRRYTREKKRLWPELSAPASDHTPGKQLELLAAWRWLLVMWSEIKKQAIDRALGI